MNTRSVLRLLVGAAVLSALPFMLVLSWVGPMFYHRLHGVPGNGDALMMSLVSVTTYLLMLVVNFPVLCKLISMIYSRRIAWSAPLIALFAVSLVLMVGPVLFLYTLPLMA
jgi:hypothetical protein